MALIRMKTHHLKKGMVIKSDVYNRSGVILVPTDTIVTKEVFDLLSRHFVEDVIVDYVTETAPLRKPEITSIKSEQQQIKIQEFVEAYQVAEETLSQNLKDIVQQDKELDIPVLLDSLHSIINKTDGELNLCDMLSYIERSSDTLYAHSINVALYAQLLARWLDFSSEDMELISLAGLLHDIGHMKYPTEAMQNFTLHAEFNKTCHEQHPTYAYKILQNKSIDHRIKQAVLTHHERLDESGFPLKVSFRNINQFSRVLAIADSYVTLITEETGYPALTPFEALKALQDTDYKKYDPQFLQIFIERIAQNYIQHEVLLTDGQTATIIMLNKLDLTKPLVQIGNMFLDLALIKGLGIKKFLS